MEDAAELANLSATVIQDAEGAGVYRFPVGRLRDQLRTREIPVRLPRLSHAHNELRLFQHLADQAN